jgi:hypothetical protein
MLKLSMSSIVCLPVVVLAGFCGGIGRGLVEGPVEYIKVRRQVGAAWRASEMLSGSGVTVFRNSLLFSGFMIYVDISKQLVPGGLVSGGVLLSE